MHASLTAAAFYVPAAPKRRRRILRRAGFRIARVLDSVERRLSDRLIFGGTVLALLALAPSIHNHLTTSPAFAGFGASLGW